MTTLVLTNTADATADYLCERMHEGAHPYVRVNTEDLQRAVDIGAQDDGIRLMVDGRAFTPSEFSSVWYRRPKAISPSNQGNPHDNRFSASEWVAAFEGFANHIPEELWVNHPSRVMGASAKLEQLSRARRLYLDVPAWCCTSSPLVAAKFLEVRRGRVIAKPLSSGYIERGEAALDTVLYTTLVHRDDIDTSVDSLGTPTLFQSAVEGGVDIRVTVVDENVCAVKLQRDGSEIDIRRRNMAGVRYDVVAVPSEVSATLLNLVRSYGLRFAAIDMMATAERWYFLEINPNGQWAWLDLVCNSRIYELFLRALSGRR